MNFHETNNLLNTTLLNFHSASLISDEGKLLASSDRASLLSTTSRLVVFQIVKKYLNPQLGDIFILNDPENGGLNYQNIFFTTRLTERIYLVFVRESNQIHFKIPPTPLYDRGIKNKTIWPFLVDQNPNAKELTQFFESAWIDVNNLSGLTSLLSDVSIPKNVQTYFKTINRLFERRFNTKALGQNEVTCKLSAQEVIKLRLSIDEKQNQRTVHADFSQSTLAKTISAASHIIESALVKGIADYYGMTVMLSQPILDTIRLTLPPQSIVAKANPSGAYNGILQKAISEQTTYLLSTMARQAKTPTFKLSPEFQVVLQIGESNYEITGTEKKIVFPDLDYLIQSQKLLPLKSQLVDGKAHLRLQIKTSEKAVIKPRFVVEAPSPFLSVSDAAIKGMNEMPIKQNDVVDLHWNLKTN